jgi:hypothetical protein
MEEKRSHQIQFTFGVLGDSQDPRALFIPALVLVGGVLLLLFAVVMGFQVANRVNSYETVTGTVVKIEGEEGAAFSRVQFYTKEGFSETVKLDGVYYVGKEVKVYYNPENPADDVLFWSYASLLVTPFILFAIGIVVVAFGLAALWSNLQRRKVYSWLLENGAKVSARVVKVLKPEDQLSAKVRSGHGLHTTQNALGFNLLSGKCRVLATWYDRNTDATFEFCSEPFVSPPHTGIADATVDVYFARGEKQVYYVDLSTVKLAQR